MPAADALRDEYHRAERPPRAMPSPKNVSPERRRVNGEDDIRVIGDTEARAIPRTSFPENRPDKRHDDNNVLLVNQALVVNGASYAVEDDERDEGDSDAATQGGIAGLAAEHPQEPVDPLVFAHRLTSLVWEICVDRRSLDHIAPWVSEEALQRLSMRVALLRQSARRSIQLGTGLGHKIHVGAHRMCHASDHTLEFCAVVVVNGQTRAIAVSVRMYSFGPRATSIDIL